MSFCNAKTYSEANNCTKIFTKVLLKEFYGWINWREDGKDSLLDVGSGPGNTVRESIFPLLSSNFSRLVVSDISPQMVELQKKEFAGYERVECEILDIGSEISEDLREKLGTFDHVTSFFCLMWVKNQKKAMENIHKLLKPGGDCFLVIVADTPVLDALVYVCEKPKWKDCFIGWQDFYAFPYLKVNEATEKGLNLMKETGFTETRAELRYQNFNMRSDREKENFLRAMPNRFSRKLSDEEKEIIFQERLAIFDRFNVGKYRNNSDKIDKPITLLILYGRKVM